MIEGVLAALSAVIIFTIASLGYAGIVLMMGVESACIPLPSEVIMPFAGYLVVSGRFSLQGVALAGALGCLLGSYVAYFVGAGGGRHLLKQYGRYLLIAPHELEIADRFFQRWGSAAVFISRLLPVVRTFIAFPAGVARMELGRFSLYTLVGSYLWCLGLAWAGMQLGEHWDGLSPYFHRFDGAVAAAILVALAAFIYTRIRGLSAIREEPHE